MHNPSFICTQFLWMFAKTVSLLMKEGVVRHNELNTACDTSAFGHGFTYLLDSLKISFLVLGVVCKDPKITDLQYDAGKLQGNITALLEE